MSNNGKGSYEGILFNKPNGFIYNQQLFRETTGDATSNQRALIRNAAIMTVAYIPVIGDCDYDARYGIGSPTKVSPFNADLSTLFVKLKGKAMTLGNYDAADVGKGLLALDSLYGLLSELDVDINCLSKYSYNNVATRGLIQATLWRDPQTAQANIANLIKRRNNIAAKMEMLPFVPGIKFLQEHIDWARYIYKDDNLDKSSLILFRRAGYYRWCCRTTDAHPGALLLSDNTSGSSYTSIDHTIIKAEDKFDILEMLLNDYALDTDFTELCAGIANAYGIDKDQYHIPTLPDDISKFTLEFKYDLDVIDSLRSADFSEIEQGFNAIVGIDEDSEGHLLYTTDFNYPPSGEFCTPALKHVANTNPQQYKSIDTGEGRIVFSYEDSPSTEAIDVIARYVHDYVHNNLTDNYSKVYGLKSEFLTGISIHYLDTDRTFKHIDALTWVKCATPGQAILSSAEADAIATTLISLPMMYLIPTDGNGIFMGVIPHRINKDIDNIGYIPRYANSTCAEAYMWNKFFTSSGSNSYKKSKKSKKREDSNKEDQQPK